MYNQRCGFVCTVDVKVFHEDQYVPVGEPITIECHASDTSERVLWDYRRSLKQDVRNVYDRRLINEYERRCTIDISKYDLTILEVQLSDTGEYWCIENEGFGIKHVTKLYVTGTLAYYR